MSALPHKTTAYDKDSRLFIHTKVNSGTSKYLYLTFLKYLLFYVFCLELLCENKVQQQ